MNGHIIVFCPITETEYIRRYSGVLKIVSFLRIGRTAGRSGTGPPFFNHYLHQHALVFADPDRFQCRFPDIRIPN